MSPFELGERPAVDTWLTIAFWRHHQTRRDESTSATGCTSLIRCFVRYWICTLDACTVRFGNTCHIVWLRCAVLPVVLIHLRRPARSTAARGSGARAQARARQQHVPQGAERSGLALVGAALLDLADHAGLRVALAQRRLHALLYLRPGRLGGGVLLGHRLVSLGRPRCGRLQALLDCTQYFPLSVRQLLSKTRGSSCSAAAPSSAVFVQQLPLQRYPLNCLIVSLRRSLRSCLQLSSRPLALQLDTCHVYCNVTWI